MYFTSGAGTRKSRNLAENPACVIAMSLKGIDLEIEGTAVKVTDYGTLHRLAKRYGDQGWPATVKDGAFTHEYSAPSAGPPPWISTRWSRRRSTACSARSRAAPCAGGSSAGHPPATAAGPASGDTPGG